MPSVLTIEGSSYAASLGGSPVIDWLRKQNLVVMAATVLGASILTSLVVSSVFVKLHSKASKAMER